jgi:hypothetical protein
MARYDPPIPALFATVHRYPEGGVERLNAVLAVGYADKVLVHEMALSLLRSPLPWAAKRWFARLQAFQWRGKDGATGGVFETSALFEAFGAGLLDQRPSVRSETAGKIFRWGRAGPRSWSVKQVDAVITTARTGVVEPETPWSSGWTKVAAAATHPLDLNGDAIGNPQIIWDSRVSFAIAELSSGPTDALRERLFVVPGKTKRRAVGRDRAQSLKAAGWRFNATPARAWATQVWGSRLVHAMSGILNSSDEFESERRHHPRWTSFDVAAALFVEGY